MCALQYVLRTLPLVVGSWLASACFAILMFGLRLMLYLLWLVARLHQYAILSGCVI